MGALDAVGAQKTRSRAVRTAGTGLGTPSSRSKSTSGSGAGAGAGAGLGFGSRAIFTVVMEGQARLLWPMPPHDPHLYWRLGPLEEEETEEVSDIVS